MEQLDKLLVEVKAQGDKITAVADAVAKLKVDLASAVSPVTTTVSLSDEDKAAIDTLAAEVAKNSAALEVLVPTPAPVVVDPVVVVVVPTEETPPTA